MSPFGKKTSPKKESRPVDLWGSHKVLQRRAVIRKLSSSGDIRRITQGPAPRSKTEIAAWEKKLFTPEVTRAMRQFRDPKQQETALRRATIKRGTVEERRRFELLKQALDLKK